MVPLLLGRCATLAPCPGELLPVVEIQVNNSASSHDDYGKTISGTPLRARITNPLGPGGVQNFPGGVGVEVRNPAPTGSLRFANTAFEAGALAMFRTLPADGGWNNFFVRGTATNTVDKSAIVELVTANTCDEVVLARKAMMIPPDEPPITGGNPLVEVEINNTPATLDDYVAWSPMRSRVRWSNGAPNTVMTVSLRNMPGTDHLRFAGSALAGGATATETTLSLTLNGNGTWTTFHVAGNFSSPSAMDKDAVLEVRQVNPANVVLLSREGLMVRIRKNANTLSAAERDRYLQALKKAGMTYVEYIDFVRTHSRMSMGVYDDLAHRQAHAGSGFLPWHRAFVLHLERVLQAADPSVALHYWKFDSNAPNVFTQQFMGANSAGPFVLLALSNPIKFWLLPGEGVPVGIQRRTPYGTGHPDLPTDVATLAMGTPIFQYLFFREEMEGETHNPAHALSGFDDDGNAGSWIAGSPALATRDPLFFFLHSNVDRLWAKWQWLHNRSLPTHVFTYDLQGSHDAPAPGVPSPDYVEGGIFILVNRTLGQYADDTMWPWDNVTGGVFMSTAQRPDIAILKPFPIVLTGSLPLLKPTVRSMIDYAATNAAQPSVGLDFGYDDFNPFQ